MASLGDRIRDLRESRDIPQKEFAKMIGISNVVLSRYESGDRKPDYDTLKKIADTLSVSTDYLLGHAVDESKRTVMGKEVDLSNLTENQRIVLDWAMSQEALSFNGDKEDLMKILDRLAVIFEYEKIQAENKNGKKS